MKVILQPCGCKESQKHFEKTIQGMNFNLERLKQFLNKEEYDNLLKIYPSKKCMIWGLKKYNKGKLSAKYNTWKRIDKGDITLFSGNKKIFLKATITYKIENSELAKYLWDCDDDNETWELIYFLDEAQNIDISYEKFNLIVGYKKNYIIQGFSLLNNEATERFLNYYNFESYKYNYNNLNEQEFFNSLEVEETNPFQNTNNLDSVIETTKRDEQKYLRSKLFNNMLTCKCSICGKEYPIEFLWCSHIKKRCLCTLEEKKDYKNIVTAMCKFGCDELYEKGYIGVKDGKVIILKHSDNENINNYLTKINNNNCLNYNEKNKKYYDAHIKINSKEINT